MGALRLVCTAPPEWVAGYDYLLVAVRRLLDEGVHVRLRIPADRAADEQVRYDIADMSLGLAVTLMSAPARPILADADVFALAAVRGDHAPLVREAMAAGLPVVCFGTPELAGLVDTAVGVAVPLRDVDALARAIARLAADPPLRHAMGNAARRRRVSPGVIAT